MGTEWVYKDLWNIQEMRRFMYDMNSTLYEKELKEVLDKWEAYLTEVKDLYEKDEQTYNDRDGLMGTAIVSVEVNQEE